MAIVPLAHGSLSKNTGNSFDALSLIVNFVLKNSHKTFFKTQMQNIDFKTYPAKILLFGEYLVLQGEDALAVPISNFGGKLALAESSKENNIAPFVQYLGALPNIYLKQELLESTDLSRLVFQSDIPVGYGAGSSGALTAAVCDAFVEKYDGSLQEALASMEDFFHGSSSGLDPLVSFLGKATSTIHEDLLQNFYLLNTGISRKTAPLVQIFREKAEQHSFDELAGANKVAIASIENNEVRMLQESIAQISEFQFEHFQEMIPGNYKLTWKESLNDEQISIKLCGAGGGGFLLVFSEDEEYVRDWAENRNIDLMKILRYEAPLVKT